MNDRWVRAAMLAVITACLVLAVLTGVRRIRHRDVVRAQPRTNEVSVGQTYQPDAPNELVVRGYVVDAGYGLPPHLCTGLTRGVPPTCVGPYIELVALDLGRLSVQERRVQGRAYVWTPRPVSLAGRRRVGSLTVVDILP